MYIKKKHHEKHFFNVCSNKYPISADLRFLKIKKKVKKSAFKYLLIHLNRQKKILFLYKFDIKVELIFFLLLKRKEETGTDGCYQLHV